MSVACDAPKFGVYSCNSTGGVIQTIPLTTDPGTDPSLDAVGTYFVPLFKDVVYFVNGTLGIYEGDNTYVGHQLLVVMGNNNNQVMTIPQLTTVSTYGGNTTASGFYCLLRFQFTIAQSVADDGATYDQFSIELLPKTTKPLILQMSMIPLQSGT